MGDLLNNAASGTVIVLFLAAVFSYVVLKPLNKSIDSLEKAIKGLSDEMKAGEERRHAMEIRLAEIDQSTRSAHHRLDDHINKEG